MDIVVAGIAVAAFVAVVLVFTGAFSGSRHDPVRIAADPEDERWMTIEEVARLLETDRADVAALVERRAVPFFVLPGGSTANPAHYRFRRDEIDAWTIG